MKFLLSGSELTRPCARAFRSRCQRHRKRESQHRLTCTHYSHAGPVVSLHRLVIGDGCKAPVASSESLSSFSNALGNDEENVASGRLIRLAAAAALIKGLTPSG